MKGNSIVYINQATNNSAVALLYVIATCGSLFFSKVRAMVLFGAANLVILLAVLEFKRYAFTSLWCAYAAIASVIILAYFWRSSGNRPPPLRAVFVKVSFDDSVTPDGLPRYRQGFLHA